jgi:lysozyme family protein
VEIDHMTSSEAALAPGYLATLASARVIPDREREIDEVAHRLLKFVPKYYDEVERKTGVPAIWQATVFEREASSRFNLYFGNGDPLDRRTTHVPKNRGPFSTWIDGTLDAIRLDHISAMKDWPSFCYYGELWNGFGPRAHGVHTGYLWGGMTPYTGGKYVADGVWSPTYYDRQLGIVPVALRMIELDPSLAFADAVPHVESPSTAPAAPHPVMGQINIRWVQSSLNKLRIPGTPLLVDGNVGRGTMAVVRVFQLRNRLTVDGLPGPQTVKALTASLETAGMM